MDPDLLRKQNLKGKSLGKDPYPYIIVFERPFSPSAPLFFDFRLHTLCIVSPSGETNWDFALLAIGSAHGAKRASEAFPVFFEPGLEDPAAMINTTRAARGRELDICDGYF